MEIGHVGNGFYFVQDALLGAADHELALMCRDGAESTAAETAAVHVDRKTDHLIGGDAFPFVFRVWQACVGQVERTIDFLGRHRRVGRVDNHPVSTCLLDQSLSFETIALLLDVVEVLCM